MLVTCRDVSSVETIRAVLVGNNWDEHIFFALTQLLEPRAPPGKDARPGTAGGKPLASSESPSEGKAGRETVGGTAVTATA